MTAIVNRPLPTGTRAPSPSPASGTPAKPAKKKGVLHYIGVGLSFGLLALVSLIAVLVIALPMLTKSTPYTVLTSSMTPSYPAGTLVIVKPTDPQQIRIGDVVTYQLESNKPGVVTHRVTQIIQPNKPGATISFVTKGDANSLVDAKPVLPVQVRGTVWYAVPYLGWVDNVINGDSRSVIIPIVAGGLFLYAGYMAASLVVAKRRKRAVAALQSPESNTEPDVMDAELQELLATGSH